MTDLYDLRSGAATIVIDDGPYTGVEVVVLLDAPYRVRREAARLHREFREAAAGSDEEAAAVDALYGLMAREIVLAWNLTLGDEPVPVTLDGLHRASLDLNMTVLGTWIRYVGQVMPPFGTSSPPTTSEPPPTPTPSPDGGSTPEPTTTELPSTP